MSARTILIIVNVTAIVAIVAYIGFRVVSRDRYTKTPENLTPFYDDDVLEGAHLERVLGVALIALIVVVLALLAYFIWEPFREVSATTGFKDRSIERGAVLFSNKDSAAYDSTKSLLCANCHGVDGGGGFASYVVKSDDPRCDPKQTVNADLAAKQPYCLPKQVSWQAPNLQLAGLRYSRDQLTQIITYGRPGTPMPAWGVASGKGALQEQSIQDLVTYVESLVTTPTKAQALATKQVQDSKKQLSDPAVRAAADQWVIDARAELVAAQAQRDALPATASADDHATYDKLVQQKQEAVTVAEGWQQTTQSASDGQILFQNNCARCHTRGWSYFDPTKPQANPTPGIMGGGAYGPNLTGGDVNNQFVPPTGDDELFSWIAIGVDKYQGYGVRGISSGRMPHFGAVLTKSQIEAIMAYERSL